MHWFVVICLCAMGSAPVQVAGDWISNAQWSKFPSSNFLSFYRPWPVSKYVPRNAQPPKKDPSNVRVDAQRILELHNVYRKKVASGSVKGQPAGRSIKPLQWSKDLEVTAQRHANKCQFRHNRASERATKQWAWVGQNIAYSNSIDKNVELWFNEHKVYNYKTNRCRGMCGHYTQLVWAKTTHVGCGVSRCKFNGHNTVFVVCNYGPGGNVNKARPY